ncbi:hypothetical protein ACOSQ3_028575 [Xanthoceras sorbifolium]
MQANAMKDCLDLFYSFTCQGRVENFKANYMPADIKDSISLLSWTPPPIGWLKVNVNGSAANVIISAGGVIRDHERNLVRGFSMNIGGGSILEAELWGILEGLKIENGIADGFSKLGHVLDRGITTFEEPPTPVFNLFQDNCAGVIVVRTSFGP